MGYCANSVDTEFTVPAEKIPAALAALNAAFGGDEGANYTDLSEAVEDNGSFHDCFDGGINDDDWHLGYTYDKWFDTSEEILRVLAPFATEGSHVRCIGEDDSLFGYRVVAGKLEEEVGDFTWQLARERYPRADF